MPWKECHVMDERVRFVARLLDGEKMATLCAEFGISRKTGYKIYERYKDAGVQGLTDRSAARCGKPTGCRRRSRRASSTSNGSIPIGGAPKIREKLLKQLPDLSHPRRSARCTPCSTASTW